MLSEVVLAVQSPTAIAANVQSAVNGFTSGVPAAQQIAQFIILPIVVIMGAFKIVKTISGGGGKGGVIKEVFGTLLLGACCVDLNLIGLILGWSIGLLAGLAIWAASKVPA